MGKDFSYQGGKRGIRAGLMAHKPGKKLRIIASQQPFEILLLLRLKLRVVVNKRGKQHIQFQHATATSPTQPGQLFFTDHPLIRQTLESRECSTAP